MRTGPALQGPTITYLPRQGWSSRNDHLEVAMNTIRRIHRLAGLLAASAAALLVLAAASPAMATTVLYPVLRAQRSPSPGPSPDPHQDRWRHARMADHAHRGRSRGPVRHLGRGRRPGPCHAAPHRRAKRLKHPSCTPGRAATTRPRGSLLPSARPLPGRCHVDPRTAPAPTRFQTDWNPRYDRHIAIPPRPEEPRTEWRIWPFATDNWSKGRTARNRL